MRKIENLQQKLILGDPLDGLQQVSSEGQLVIEPSLAFLRENRKSMNRVS